MEPRVVPSLTWTTIGEGSVTGNTVTMGVVGRGEFQQQPIDFHGAYAQLPAAKHYEIAFDYDLSTWDSYNADTGDGTGYWDSFSVSITATPYPQLNVLTDPLQFPFVYGGNSWTDGVLENSKGEKVITADFNVATPRYLNVVLDTKTTPTADNNYPSWGTVTVITGDLAMVKSDSTEVPDNQQQSPGGFVALNNDNDNYNFTGGTTPVVDKDENAKVAGENDLVPIVLHPIDPVSKGGNYSLANISPDLKIWKTADKDGAVDGTTTFDATKTTTLYVEGVTQSAGKAKDGIDLKWTDGKVTATMDQVKYTVYTVTGATDVPGYSTYTYKATIPGGGTGSWTADDGTVKTGAATNTATILWGAGPVVGFANFTPSPGWTVKRDVNVVQVDLDIAGATNSLTYRNPPTQSGTSALINSTSGALAEEAKLRVATLAGPVVDGNMRGVKFIEMGFIQNGRFTAKNAVYDGLAPAKRRVSSLQDGTYHIDYFTNAPASTAPWYDSKAATGTRGFLGPTVDAKQTNVDFNVGDRPSLLATDMPVITGVQANVYNIVFDLNLYFGVRTTEAVNGSETVYTQRAKAAWQFDGTGTVDGKGVWTQTGMGNTGSAKFAEVKDGTIVPITTGTPINTLFGTETWSTVAK